MEALRAWAEGVLGGCEVRAHTRRGGVDVLQVRLEDGALCALSRYPQLETEARRAVALFERLADLPMPEVLRADLATRPPWILTRWPEGRPLSAHLAEADAGAEATLGRSVGRLLAALGETRFSHPGYLEADLSVEPLPSDGFDPFLEVVVEAAFGDALAHLGDARANALWDLCQVHAERLAPHHREARLVHGAFAPEHIWLDEAGAVRALVDWQHAQSGSPLVDLATLLAATEGWPVFQDAVLAAWSAEPPPEDLSQRLALIEIAVLLDGLDSGSLERPERAVARLDALAARVGR